MTTPPEQELRAFWSAITETVRNGGSAALYSADLPRLEAILAIIAPTPPAESMEAALAVLADEWRKTERHGADFGAHPWPIAVRAMIRFAQQSAKPEEAVKDALGRNTVGGMIAILEKLPRDMPVYAATFVDQDGKRRAACHAPSVSRERVVDGRWIHTGDETVDYSLVFWANPDERASSLVEEEDSRG